MIYENIGCVIQIMGTDIDNSTSKVNCYISEKYGWKILAVLQVSDTNFDRGYSCALFILGHEDEHPTHPGTKEYMR